MGSQCITSTEFQLGRLEKNSGETDKRQIKVKAIGQTELEGTQPLRIISADCTEKEEEVFSSNGKTSLLSS